MGSQEGNGVMAQRDQFKLFLHHRGLAVMQRHEDYGYAFEAIAELMELKDAEHAQAIYAQAVVMRERGRRREGRKLNLKQVNTIRTALREGHTAKQIAQWFNINAGTVRKIANGEIWKGR